MSFLIDMYNKAVYFFLLFYYVGLSENKVSSCVYKLSNDTDEVVFNGKSRHVSSTSYTAYINLCDTLPIEYCGYGKKICINHTGNNTDWIISGSELIPAYLNSSIPRGNNTLYLNGIASKFCDNLQKISQVLVRFKCEGNKDESALIVKDACNFEIHLLHPTLCIPQCAVRVYNQLIDLRPLKKIYHVHDDLRNFSIGFCTTNPECDNPSSIFSCLLRENETLPLSGSLETLQYYDDSNTIKIRGKLSGKNKKSEKTVEIHVKCDWTKSEPELFLLKLNQPNIFRFEMVTSQSCTKYNFSRQLKHGPFIYYLTSLQKENGYYKINIGEGEDIFINIFGVLKLPGEPNDCSRSFAQICLKNGSEYINLGSIQTGPKFEEDILYINFKNGRVCSHNTRNDPYQQYESTIKFICDQYDKGLSLIHMDKCEVMFQWETPAACQKYDKSSCPISHVSNHDCILNLSNKVYNLTRLYKENGKYIIQDPTEKVQYFLNICGPVVDDDVQCSNDNLAFLKQMTEPDITKRLIGLGKIKDHFLSNNHLVLELSSGGFCSSHDYQSFIYLECSEKEGYPELRNKTDCRIDFIWKTPAACPIIKANSIDSKCVFESHLSSEKIDLNDLNEEHKYVKINVSGILYMFDICSINEGRCNLNENCVYIPAKKHLVTHGSTNYIEFSLDRPCNSLSEFNKTLMELVCDPIENNDHYSMPQMTDCFLTFRLFSHLICKQKDASFYSYDVHEDENNALEETGHRNCSISNPNTDYTIDIKDLRLNFTTSYCPKINFNYTQKFTELTYETEKVCGQQEGKQKLLVYKVLLSCSEHTSYNTQITICQEIHIFEQEEYCKLLEKSSSAIWLVVTGSLLIIGISILTTWVYFKYFHRWKNYEFICNYRKDGDR